MEYGDICTQEYKTDIIDRKIGLLTVKGLVSVKRYATRFRYFYLCQCDCGNTKTVERHNLTGATPHTTSCGCLRRRAASKSKTWTGYGDISGKFWYSIKSKADERELSFNLTIEQAWQLYQKQQARCALSGLPLSLKSVKSRYNERTASLDRIDNTRGYELDNVQWVHKDINWMKGTFQQDYFIELCKKVAEHDG